MNKASRFLIIMRYPIIALMAVSLPFLFNNCSPVHAPGSGDFSSFVLLGSGKCDPILIQGFKPYHDVLKNNCASCHVPGGQGNGAFAQGDLKFSFSAFYAKGEDKIFSFATNPSHKPPFTGDATKAELEPNRTIYKTAEIEYENCLKDTGGPAPTPGGGGNLPKPKLFTGDKVIPANTDTLELTYNLATELQGSSIAGSSFKITATQFLTNSGDTGYDISLPKLTGGNAAVYIKNIGIRIDGQLQLASFQNVDRWVAQNIERTLQTGSVRIVIDNTKNVSLSIGFEELREDALMNHTPTRYSQLTQNGGVFARRCASCHSANNPSDNISLVSTGYTVLSLQGLFKPYDLVGSQIWDSVNTGRMPTNGPLNNADLEAVRGWILDGAPQ